MFIFCLHTKFHNAYSIICYIRVNLESQKQFSLDWHVLLSTTEYYVNNICVYCGYLFHV